MQAFLRRHGNLAVRTLERVSKARAHIIEPYIRNWFNRLTKELNDLGCSEILNEPSRVFNTDETCIQLCPSTGRVMSFRGRKNVYEISPGPEKSTLTFLGTFNAAGEIVAPTMIFPYVRLID